MSGARFMTWPFRSNLCCAYLAGEEEVGRLEVVDHGAGVLLLFW